MVSIKVMLAVVVVSVAFAQIDARPTDNDPAATTDWKAPFEAALQNLTSKMTEIVGDQSEITKIAKNGLNNFNNGLKNELDNLSKSLEGKVGVPDVLKESAKNWQSTIDTYTKGLPEDLSGPKLNEKFQQTMKYINDQATELSKKAGSNSEVEKEIKDFSVKQFNALAEQIKSIQNKFAEKKN